MKINKKMQYALLFCLYLSRAGRATVEHASANLNLSLGFLSQVASKLRRAGVLVSVKGPNGGYELNGSPTVKEVFLAVTGRSLLTKTERHSYATGEHEHRAMANFTDTLTASMDNALNLNVCVVSAKIVESELAMMDRLSSDAQVN